MYGLIYSFSYIIRAFKTFRSDDPAILAADVLLCTFPTSACELLLAFDKPIIAWLAADLVQLDMARVPRALAAYRTLCRRRGNRCLAQNLFLAREVRSVLPFRACRALIAMREQRGASDHCRTQSHR